jgi:hypothetical protein
MNDDTGISPVALGAVIALLIIMGHLFASFFTFARWAQ